VPSSGDIGVGVSILSYGGGVQFGLITDHALCPEPQQIIDRFAPEFEQLTLVTLMLPWGDEAG
jgi:diacylglycerol O-acyltransferase / wax synthase